MPRTKIQMSILLKVEGAYVPFLASIRSMPVHLSQPLICSASDSVINGLFTLKGIGAWDHICNIRHKPFRRMQVGI